jgi:hypothetical protein
MLIPGYQSLFQRLAEFLAASETRAAKLTELYDSRSLKLSGERKAIHSAANLMLRCSIFRRFAASHTTVRDAAYTRNQASLPETSIAVQHNRCAHQKRAFEVTRRCLAGLGMNIGARLFYWARIGAIVSPEGTMVPWIGAA